MASLVNCGVCKKQHADDVKRCPHCGTKYSKPLSKRPFAIIFAALFGLVVYQCSSIFNGTSTPTNSAGGLPVQTIASQVTAPPTIVPAAPQSKWDYETQTDQMTGKPAQYATLTSDNSLAFDFPYAGANKGQLTVRQHPNYGQSVIFSIEKGQITCSVYDCKMSIRFDSGPPVVYAGTQPADGSSNHVFLQGSGKFIAQAKKSKQILVEFTAYRQGANVMTFTANNPLTWPVK